MKKLLTLIIVFASTLIWAQTKVSGTVTDTDGQPLPGANIVLDGSTGTVSDFDGNFSLSTDQQPPFSLNISSVGFESATVEVTSECNVDNPTFRSTQLVKLWFLHHICWQF